jgi:hypothetical protein
LAPPFFGNDREAATKLIKGGNKINSNFSIDCILSII